MYQPSRIYETIETPYNPFITKTDDNKPPEAPVVETAVKRPPHKPVSPHCSNDSIVVAIVALCIVYVYLIGI